MRQALLGAPASATGSHYVPHVSKTRLKYNLVLFQYVVVFFLDYDIKGKQQLYTLLFVIKGQKVRNCFKVIEELASITPEESMHADEL